MTQNVLKCQNFPQCPVCGSVWLRNRSAALKEEHVRKFSAECYILDELIIIQLINQPIKFSKSRFMLRNTLTQ